MLDGKALKSLRRHSEARLIHIPKANIQAQRILDIVTTFMYFPIWATPRLLGQILIGAVGHCPHGGVEPSTPSTT